MQRPALMVTVTEFREVVRLGEVIVGEVQVYPGGRPPVAYIVKLTDYRKVGPAASRPLARRAIAEAVTEWLQRAWLLDSGDVVDVVEHDETAAAIERRTRDVYEQKRRSQKQASHG